MTNFALTIIILYSLILLVLFALLIYNNVMIFITSKKIKKITYNMYDLINLKQEYQSYNESKPYKVLVINKFIKKKIPYVEFINLNTNEKNIVTVVKFVNEYIN